MVVAILGDEEIKAEIIEKGFNDAVEILWADSLQSLRIIEADAYFDLLFENDRERVERLKFLLPKPVFVNSVIHTCNDIPADFFRINAWPTMINRKITEVVVPHNIMQQKLKQILDELGWDFQVVPDTIGMITPRIVSMIINEAFFSLHEKVSTREEIDIAMKLGTNYPYGPFEWCEKIGEGRIRQLLHELQKTDPRYTIAPGLNGEFKWH
jgi:3-hydroxybutyryl-CoA dehydrogenase